MAYNHYRAFRGLSGTYNVRANERDRAAPRDIECLVYFLNNTQHKFVIDRRSKGQSLLDSVFKHLNLIETDFFGLKYLPQESQRNQQTTAKNESLLSRSQSSSNSYLNNNTNTSTNSSSTNNNNNNSNHHHHHHHHHNHQANNCHQHSPTSSASLSQSSQSINNVTHVLNHTNSIPECSINLNNRAIPITSIVTKPTSNDVIITPPTVNASSAKTIPTVSLVNPNICISNNNNNIISNNAQNNKELNNSNQTNNDDNSSEFIEERWLDPTKSIRKQYKSGPPYKFYFRVRFYVTDPSKLADDTTRNHLYLQLRHDILNNRLIVPPCSAILLASYILQSEFGDYRRELLEENYASNFKLLPVQDDVFRKKVIELHKQHKSLSSADAEYHFLVHAAEKLDSYGVEFYNARDQFKTNVLIGVSSNGIVVYKDNKRMNQFSWAKIIKIMFKKKMFSVQLRRDSGENCDNFIEFNLLSNQACKSFWEECVAQHSFFRLHQPKSPPKKFFSFLNFSSKFQYNGKTEYQTMEESRKRTFSHFSRTLSKRYARRTLPIGRPLWSDQQSSQNHQEHQHLHQQDNNSDSQSRLSSTSCSSNSKSSNADNITNAINNNNNNHHKPSSSTTTTTTLAESIKTIKKGLESDDLIKAFDKLSRKKDDESHEESRLMENIDKNRYQDILPYDSTRVQLLDSMTGDYINASFVDMTVPPGIINRYIATQGPLSSTCDDFWQMIWEQNCSLIIMVTPLIEAGRVKCHKYWPDEKSEVRYGQLLVKNMSEKSKTATIDRTIQLSDVKVSLISSDHV